jgi:hypothetical protein
MSSVARIVEQWRRRNVSPLLALRLGTIDTVHAAIHPQAIEGSAGG